MRYRGKQEGGIKEGRKGGGRKKLKRDRGWELGVFR